MADDRHRPPTGRFAPAGVDDLVRVEVTGGKIAIRHPRQQPFNTDKITGCPGIFPVMDGREDQSRADMPGRRGRQGNVTCHSGPPIDHRLAPALAEGRQALARAAETIMPIRHRPGLVAVLQPRYIHRSPCGSRIPEEGTAGPGFSTRLTRRPVQAWNPRVIGFGDTKSLSDLLLAGPFSRACDVGAGML